MVEAGQEEKIEGEGGERNGKEEMNFYSHHHASSEINVNGRANYVIRVVLAWSKYKFHSIMIIIH